MVKARALLELPQANAHPRTLGVFFRADEAFMDALAEKLSGLRVLEVFSGNGFLAANLARRGIEIKATSLRSGHDAHAEGFFFDVEECEAKEAVLRYGVEHDILLMCWPTVTEDAIRAVRLWTALCNAQGRPAPIAYVGEVTNYAKNHLGGCATDAFFDEVSPVLAIPGYRGNMLEQAFIGAHRDAMHAHAAPVRSMPKI